MVKKEMEDGQTSNSLSTDNQLNTNKNTNKL